jgi:hypothetical protein
MRLRLLERGARAGKLGVQPSTGALELGQTVGSGCRVRLGARALCGCALALCSAGTGRGRRRLRLGGGLVLVEDGDRLARGPEGDDRARRLLVLSLGVPGDSGGDPLHHGAVAFLEALQTGYARPDDLERLEEAVELEAVGHLDRHQGEVHLDLGAVLAPCGCLHVAARGRDRLRNGERLEQAAADHGAGGPAEHVLRRPAPARDAAAPVRKHEAGVHELAQQLLDGFGWGHRLQGRGLLGHRCAIGSAEALRNPSSVRLVHVSAGTPEAPKLS